MKNAIIEADGKFYQKAKPVMLPAEKATNIYKQTKNVYGVDIVEAKIEFTQNETWIRNMHLINNGKASTNDQAKFKFFNLYFLSEEEIKEGDWCYNFGLSKIEKAPYRINPNKEFTSEARFIRKIIATTDESLKFDYYDQDSYGESQRLSFPRPSNEFLQAYCKAGGKIDEVLVEVEEHFDEDTSKDYVEGMGQPAIVWHTLKVAPDNTITIKPVKEKSYTKQDLIYAVSEIAAKLGHAKNSEQMKIWNDATNEWIQENP